MVGCCSSLYKGICEFLSPDYLKEAREAQARAALAASQATAAAGPKKLTLLDKLGGKDAVDAAVR